MTGPAGSTDAEDRRFYAAFVSGALLPRDFHHREHLRLAYLCLTVAPPNAALTTFRRLLREFLVRHRVDSAKYHETLTCAWLQTVDLHMALTQGTTSFGDFIAQHPTLADSNHMFAHYSRERLISPHAREGFLEPDLQAIARNLSQT
jgi:hypothetical protein